MKKLLLILVLLVGCNGPRNYEGEAAGVTFAARGLDGGDGTIKNTNDFPVRVRAIYNNGYGESTVFVVELKPEEKYTFKARYSFSFWGFYVHKSGSPEVIGFIRAYWVE